MAFLLLHNYTDFIIKSIRSIYQYEALTLIKKIIDVNAFLVLLIIHQA